MLNHKETLNVDDQLALELPSRDLMLVTIIVTRLIRDVEVDTEITVQNVDVAAQVCAALLAGPTVISCEIQQ